MLSVEHQNLFQRLWSEVKYLCKLATAGSKEAKALAKVEKAFADRYSVKNIIKAFADNGITLSQKNASELQNLYKKAVELPTQYFEAKPGREVDFEEAAVFVIPNDLDANLKQQLLDKGYDIAEYDPLVEGDRQNVVNSFEEYKFSLSAKAEKSTDTESDGVRYSFHGYAEDGKGKYQGNFSKGTPKAAKSERILEYIQKVWSKKPIRLKINDASGEKYVYAEFDPYYDESGNTPTDASKLMGGNRHGNSSEQRVTLDLADDYYQIASDAIYNYSKDETGKTNPAHKDVSKWHYFVNDIYFAEYGSSEYAPYRVSINIKEKTDGNFVYSFSAEKEKKSNTQRTLHAVVNGEKNTANAQLFNDIISNPPQNVKQRQLEIINQYNPAPNSYNTWIRTVDDIKTFEEALNDGEYVDYDEFSPDYTREMAEKAIKEGEITVYSSYPIEQGTFVTPSRMEAESYSGNGKVYSKKVPLDSVAWIDVTQGQYAEAQYSLVSENQSREAVGNYNVYGRDVKLSKESNAASEDSAKRAATKEDLQAGFDFIINGMQDTASYESAEEERREAFDAITDADEVGENRGVYEDGTSKESVKVINDRDLSYVTNILKDTLHLNSRQVGEVKKIIREYSTQENPNKDDLYRKIEEQFE